MLIHLLMNLIVKCYQYYNICTVLHTVMMFTLQSYERVSSPKNKNDVINDSHVVPSHTNHSLRYFRFSPRAFSPSIENICTVYCLCPERK